MKSRDEELIYGNNKIEKLLFCPFNPGAPVRNGSRQVERTVTLYGAFAKLLAHVHFAYE